MTRIVTVFAATGTQGSSVVRALLKDGTFTPRAITRDVASQASKDLISQGAQVAQADSANPNEESLKKALEGSEAVFIVTPPLPTVDDKKQAIPIIDAAKAVGVKYVIWSSLPGISKASKGEITNLKASDDKAEVDDYLRASGLPHTILLTASFLENLWKFAGYVPQIWNKDPSGESYTLSLNRAGDLPQFWSHISRDLGATVLVLLKSYNDESKKGKVLGQTFSVVTDKIPGKEFAAILTKGLGKPVNFVSLESANEIQDNVADFFNKFGKDVYEQYGIPDSRLVDLGVKFTSVEDFVEDNKARLLA